MRHQFLFIPLLYDSPAASFVFPIMPSVSLFSYQCYDVTLWEIQLRLVTALVVVQSTNLFHQFSGGCLRCRQISIYYEMK